MAMSSIDSIIHSFDSKTTNLLNSILSHCTPKNKFDSEFAIKTCQEILDLTEKTDGQIDQTGIVDFDKKDDKSKCPCDTVSRCLHHLLKNVDTQFSRLIIFQIIDIFLSQLKITDFLEGKLFEAIVQKLPWYAVRLRSNLIRDPVKEILEKWRTFNLVDASMIEELEQIIFHNHQPDDHSTNFLKNLRKEFDCMRFLRILAKVRDYETKLDHKRKALRSMPVQSDHPDIAAARKTFVGDDKLFLMHFNRHYKELSDYTESRRKLLSYHQEIANLFPDAYRYFHSLYVDSNSVSDAYEKFDERVDKQIKKLFIKIQKLKLDESLEHILKLSLQQSQKGKGSATVFDIGLFLMFFFFPWIFNFSNLFSLISKTTSPYGNPTKPPTLLQTNPKIQRNLRKRPQIHRRTELELLEHKKRLNNRNDS